MDLRVGNRQLVRVAILAAMFAASAGMQAVAARMFPTSAAPAPAVLSIQPSGEEYRVAPDPPVLEVPQGVTARLLRLLHLDNATPHALNLVTRAVVFSSTGLMALWFVAGGIPRRRSSIAIVHLSPTSERVRVFETPRLQVPHSDVFARAYEAELSPGVVPLPLDSAPNGMTASTAALLELMAHPVPAQAVPDHAAILQTLDATISREAEADDLIMAEVEQYARVLLRGSHPDSPSDAVNTEADESSGQVDVPEPEPSLAPMDEEAVELESQISSAPPEPTMATQPRRIEDDDVLGLSELVSPNVSTELPPLAMEELFNAVSSVEAVSAAQVDPYDLLQCEIAPAAEKPYVPEQVATILRPEMLSSLLRPQSARTTAVPPAVAVEPGPLFEQRIIIVGDSEAVLEVEKRIVISAGARVITFRRFSDAVSFADEKDFDLMVVNGMTEDGFSATKVYDWLVAHRPGWQRRSAFALSAPDPNADDFAARTGAWCIVHPFGPKELVSFLHAVITPPA